MDINYNFVSFLDAVGFIQGLTLGTIILVMNKNRHKSTTFLGLFLIFFSFKLLRYIELRTGVGAIYPEFFLLPFNFSWLLFPLFFIYCQKISFFSNQRTHYWVLYPGIASFVAQIVIFFLPYETKQNIFNSNWYLLIFTYIGIFYAWGIGIWNLRLLNRHKKAVNNFYSVVEARELNWAQAFLIYSLLSSWIIHVLYFFRPENFYVIMVFALFDLVAISWIAVFGLQQHNTHSLLTNTDSKIKLQKEQVSDKGKVVPILDKNELLEISRDIEKVMVQQNLFLNDNLTIADVSKALDLHPKKISLAINNIFNQNFNNYVNGYRVEYAKQLLENFSEKNLSIEGVGIESGFKSKSAFYSSFRKFTGMTPTKYWHEFFESA